VLVRSLVRIAVNAAGRRAADAPVLDDDRGAALVTQAGDDIVVVLDHAGPAAAAWSTERPVGASAVAEVNTGRLPRALDDDGWRAIVADFVRGAEHVRRAGGRPVVALDDDGLLHGCLSPLAGPPCPERARAVVAACAPCDVLVVVEDLAPGGTDATSGLSHARALVDAAAATTLYATCGTARLAPLSLREKGDSGDDTGHFLASAAWCVGHVDIPVVAVGRARAANATLAARARRFGLAGVVRA
jgi:2,4-dienoyl-CoA reductase-like NADH-dependent reductase (Old Yellow Enzyme family)